MLIMEEVSWMFKSGYSDIELLEYIDEHFNEIECELNGEEYKEPKKRDHNFCMYKRSDNFKVILNQFLYGGKKVVPDDIMKTIRDEIHNETNMLYPYEIPLTIPVLECILKSNELSMYKDSIYFIYFKLGGGFFPHITTKEYNTILSVFNVVSSIYDKYRPNDRKSFLNYSFVLKQLLIVLGKSNMLSAYHN